MEILDLSQKAPDDFIRLGSISLKDVSDLSLRPKCVDLHKAGFEEFRYADEEDFTTEVGKQHPDPIRLTPANEAIQVLALDTSSIELGETDVGLLCAVRGTIVQKDREGYRYTRYGPFIFHVTEANKEYLYNGLRQIYFGTNEASPTPNVLWMPGRIRNILERWLQGRLSQVCEDSILLWDGSLTAWTIDSPVALIGELLRVARSRRNVVLAISKKTKFTLSGQRIADLIDDRDTPCLLDLDEVIRREYGSYLCFFGRVYAAKFTPSCFSFRLDIDREVSKETGIDAVQKLIGNDLVVESYPETLRLAHVLSKFSASEVIGMKRLVTENYDIRVVSRPDVRQVLFGPYGGGRSSSVGGEELL